MNSITKKLLISSNLSVKEAMRQMGKVGEKILFVVNSQNQLLGSLTDGDIRRWVLRDGSLMTNINRAYNKNPLFVKRPYTIENIKQLMLKRKISWIPVVNDQNEIEDVLLWRRVFSNKEYISMARIDIPVVIMAGGKGTRLDPFTKILPKPLIPIGDKSIIEIIMDRFHRFGINEFYLSMSHKSHMIKAYFEETRTPYKLHFIEEEKPLGTAGGLKFLQDRVKTSLFVSNCDIIIESDYSEILKFHKAKKYDITIVGSFRHFVIPYGICSIENGGTLTKIEEKPEYDYLVNTGMYVLKRDVLNLIPKNQFFDMTDLVTTAKERGGRVGVFPIDEKSWIDIGQWEEYHRTIRLLELNK